MVVVCWLLLLYALAFLARAVLSWFPINPDGVAATLAGGLMMITDPLLRPLRKVLRPMQVGNVGLDFAPTIVLVVLFVVRGLVC